MSIPLECLKTSDNPPYCPECTDWAGVRSKDGKEFWFCKNCKQPVPEVVAKKEEWGNPVLEDPLEIFEEEKTLTTGNLVLEAPEEKPQGLKDWDDPTRDGIEIGLPFGNITCVYGKKNTEASEFIKAMNKNIIESFAINPDYFYSATELRLQYLETYPQLKQWKKCPKGFKNNE